MHGRTQMGQTRVGFATPDPTFETFCRCPCEFATSFALAPQRSSPLRVGQSCHERLTHQH